MLAVLAAFALAGCAEEKIPVGVDNNQPIAALYLFPVYAQLTGKTIVAPPEVRNDETLIWIKQTKPLTRTEVCKLLEQDLREQAGIIILHQDRKHAEFGFEPNKKREQ